MVSTLPRVALFGDSECSHTIVDLEWWGEMCANRGVWDEIVYYATVDGKKLNYVLLEGYWSPTERTREIRQSMGFILVFAADSRSSFQALNEIYQDIVREKTSDVPIVLCADKTDAEQREVSTEEGSEFARSIHARYIEASTPRRYNFHEVFEEMGHEMSEWLLRHPDVERPWELQATRPSHKKGKKKGLLRCVVA